MALALALAQGNGLDAHGAWVQCNHLDTLVASRIMPIACRGADAAAGALSVCLAVCVEHVTADGGHSATGLLLQHCSTTELAGARGNSDEAVSLH